MRVCFLLALVWALLAACAAPAANLAMAPQLYLPSTIASATGAPVARPTTRAITTPAVRATVRPTAAPTAAPTDELTAQANGAWEPFDVEAQKAAMLPATVSDLERAGEWNRYTIRGALDPVQRILAASQRLEYTNRDSVALDRLYFRLFPNLPILAGRLDVSNLSVDGAAVPVVYEQARGLLRVDLPQPLEPGAATTVTMDFVTRAPLNASRDAYGAFNREAGVLALASAYPLVAVVRGGVWDIERLDIKGDLVNSETALYDLALSAPAAWKLITTGVALNGRSENGVQQRRFVSGPQRDFTIAAAQLEQLSGEVDGTRVTSYFRSGSAQGGKIALDVAMNSVRIYNRRFGTYPTRELDVIEIAASNFLGVEYPGLTFITHGTYGDARTLETTVAHEVAHMWFYSTVGNDVQRESWLDEGFASYAQVIYGEEIFGPQRAQEELAEFRRRYRGVLSAGRNAPVAQHNRSFRSNYYGLVYGKAPLFLQALRVRMGEANFDSFLRSYYAQHRYGYVTGSDLLASAEQSCGCELDETYRSWILTAGRVELP
ncbi:MAG: M1 family metallopeptidase [Roseiflexaceae bacterium]|nr:M1 family metallopeptidase [Roseiflexaceae bacterium]